MTGSLRRVRSAATGDATCRLRFFRESYPIRLRYSGFEL